MKKLFPVICMIVLYACHSTSEKDKAETPADNNAVMDSTAWIEDFRQFRDAVYHGDSAKAKKYFSFPLSGENNAIWYLALTERKYGADIVDSLPFTEKDFDKYFKRIFPPEFIKTLLKIKSEELFKTGSSETELFERDTITEYNMQASFIKADQTLTLNLNFNSHYKDEEGNPVDGGESSYIYIFIIQKDGHLLFKNFLIAG